MPKPHTLPTLFDEALQISVTKLKELGYLKLGQIASGTLHWSSQGRSTGSIHIWVNTHDEQPYIELDYKYNDEPRRYKVRLITVPSNLGKSCMWFFICPKTGKRCRKLYLIGGYFLHREAFKGCMYDCQTQSKKYRDIGKTYGAYFKAARLYEQLYKKHFKKTYAGKPTKKYLQIMKQIQKAESRPYHEIKMVIVS